MNVAIPELNATIFLKKVSQTNTNVKKWKLKLFVCLLCWPQKFVFVKEEYLLEQLLLKKAKC